MEIYGVVFLVLFLIFLICANLRKLGFYFEYGIWPVNKVLVLPFFNLEGKLYLANEELGKFFRKGFFLDFRLASYFPDEIIYLPVEISTGGFRKFKMKFELGIDCRVIDVDYGDYEKISYTFMDYEDKDDCMCPIYVFSPKKGVFYYGKTEVVTVRLIPSKGNIKFLKDDIIYFFEEKKVIGLAKSLFTYK